MDTWMVLYLWMFVCMLLDYKPAQRHEHPHKHASSVVFGNSGSNAACVSLNKVVLKAATQSRNSANHVRTTQHSFDHCNKVLCTATNCSPPQQNLDHCNKMYTLRHSLDNCNKILTTATIYYKHRQNLDHCNKILTTATQSWTQMKHTGAYFPPKMRCHQMLAEVCHTHASTFVCECMHGFCLELILSRACLYDSYAWHVCRFTPRLSSCMCTCLDFLKVRIF